MVERVTSDDAARADRAQGAVHRGGVRWRSRRGMLELELLLVPYVEARLDALTAAELCAYAALLECEDWDLFQWLQGKSPPPAAHRSVVEEIRAFHASR